MEDKIAFVHLSIELKVLNITYTLNSTIEDLCIKVCKQLGIGPIARNLFSLRNFKKKYWYPPGHLLDGKEDKFEFRIRFKPSSLNRLRRIDSKAYEYFFQQVRLDVMENSVSEIVYEKHKSELIGLGVCDMYRVMLEKKTSRENVQSDYKKYIPKECIKRHSFFIKKPIQNSLARLSGYDAPYVKEQYLIQFESMAPNYPCEDHKALLQKGTDNTLTRVTLRVTSEKINYCEVDDKWITLCTIEDLCTVSMSPDCTVEIARRIGIPLYLKFSSNALLLSFVSALDGYYRLIITWTFNLCREVITPSLASLSKMKCHGPVGGEFSYAKLKEKRGNRFGTYILRESETMYNVIYLDACGKDGKPRTHRINQIGPNDFILSGTIQKFTSLAHLRKTYRDPDGQLYLGECIPASENDKSQLLLCAKERLELDVIADQEFISELLNRRPAVILHSELQVYKAQPLPENKEISDNDAVSGFFSPTAVYKALWRIEKGKKVEVAIKLLRQEELFKEFIRLTTQWSQLKCKEFVRAFGLTFEPAQGMILELVNFGPLDVYLQRESQTVKTVDLIEAATSLANAVFHLEEKDIIHGNLRCRKLLVYQHTDKNFIVKLSDPGIFRYGPSDIHWLPLECYNHPESAKRSIEADIWAVGTVIWEIFSRGGTLPMKPNIDSIKKYYASGKRLPIPKNCSVDIYQLMLECWEEDKDTRKKAQAIVRDLRHINLAIYSSRRNHVYATALPKLLKQTGQEGDEGLEVDSSDCESRASSLFTDHTSLHWDDTDETESGHFIDPTANAEDFTAFLDLLAESGIGDTSSVNDFTEENGFLGQMQGIFELTSDCNVILQGKIGQGFYGEVYRGTLEKENSKDAEPQRVAVKKLKMRSVEADLRDFEREISIMKTLKHPNVVEILGVISEPDVCLVMEFLKHGSLQSYLAINHEVLKEKKLLHFALDISTGMEYLGQKSIVHRDLAARNILVADENRVKISDFGLAQVMGKNDYYILQTDRDLPIKWYAPESLRDGKFSPRSDVWSFGVTLFEMFSFGEDPKLPDESIGQNKHEGGKSSEEEGSAELLAALEKGMRLPCPPKCPAEIYARLMNPCWAWDSHNRPDFLTLCNEIKDLIIYF
ncbi:tyrosine-protein kinase hopscotch [Leptopilina boulardi]|uniref:tyrosine-protein kinase hopscotch n=1 Tax=Leptopilina boulardi TaxID=63433 RepID=UPI0021F51C32|nr:tyrosine-protein kinase hopscotch [Leptopilina boulardi]